MSPTRRAPTTDHAPATDPEPGGYRLPVVAVRVPSSLVEKGFWGALAGTALLGVVDPPLAVLVGAGVAIARHRRS
jgi:hypothetical protein